MRKLLYLVALISIASVAFAQESGGKLVAVTAEKEVDIKNDDPAAARTIALMMATREAVEKAYGTYIKVEELPEARQIIAKAAAGLKYTILVEQERKGKYYVKIHAQVLVPDEYAGQQEEEREDLGQQMENFVQTYPQGEINWGQGAIIAYGKGEITEKGPNAEDKAARAAEIDAKAHLLEIINDIPVDDRTKAGQEPRLSFALEGFVQNSEVVARSKQGTTVQVTVQAPIRGVKGLSSAVYGYYTPEPPQEEVTLEPEPPKETKPEKKPPAKQEAPETFTGVVIDARNVTANAALFPKIQDTKKREVYGSTKVNKDDLQKRGMASYAVVSRDTSITRLFPRAIILPALFLQQTAAPSQTKRRQGYHPITVQAVDAGGKLKTNLIVSEEDAKKLKAIDEKTGALKQCKVVVVVSSEVGGMEGAASP